jgi:hypothetical protein
MGVRLANTSNLRKQIVDPTEQLRRILESYTAPEIVLRALRAAVNTAIDSYGTDSYPENLETVFDVTAQLMAVEDYTLDSAPLYSDLMPADVAESATVIQFPGRRK